MPGEPTVETQAIRAKVRAAATEPAGRFYH